jgi:hypothetical protein
MPSPTLSPTTMRPPSIVPNAPALTMISEPSV